MTAAGGIQGATEGAQELWQNSIAQGYDPKQGLYANVPESIEVGAGVGAIAQGLMDLVFGRRAGKVKTPSAPQAPQQAQDLETIQQALTQAPEAEQAQGTAPALTPEAQAVAPETQAAPTVTTTPKKRVEQKIEEIGRAHV